MSHHRYILTPTPLGELLILVSGTGLRRIAFENEDFGSIMYSYPDARPDRTGLAEEVSGWIHSYLRGRNQPFEIPLDYSGLSSFKLAVLESINRIPYGETLSYGKLAREAGHPFSVRAVATACAKNPFPLVIPCHRIVLSNGDRGKYLGGSKNKEFLLDMESKFTEAAISSTD